MTFGKIKIARFLSGAVAADGGTVTCRVVLADGSELDLGVDGRIPKQKKDRVLFIGAGYPTLPNARVISRGSKEENEVIDAVQAYVHEHASAEEAAMLLEAIVER